MQDLANHAAEPMGDGPGGQPRGGGNRLGLYSHFGYHLLRGVYAEIRHFGQILFPLCANGAHDRLTSLNWDLSCSIAPT